MARILLPNELLQPLLRGLAFCLLDARPSEKGTGRFARSASQKLYARALHDARPEQILGARSLLRLHASDFS